MAGNISDGTTCLSNVSLTGTLAAASISGAISSTGLSTSGSVTTLGTAVLSLDTVSAPSAFSSGDNIRIEIVQAASGVSLVMISRNTYYILGQSAVSGAAS